MDTKHACHLSRETYIAVPVMELCRGHESEAYFWKPCGQTPLLLNDLLQTQQHRSGSPELPSS